MATDGCLQVSPCAGLAGSQGLPMVREDITNMISEKEDGAESTAPTGPWEGNESRFLSCQQSGLYHFELFAALEANLSGNAQPQLGHL